MNFSKEPFSVPELIQILKGSFQMLNSILVVRAVNDVMFFHIAIKHNPNIKYIQDEWLHEQNCNNNTGN